jgi:hypothetical protein
MISPKVYLRIVIAGFAESFRVSMTAAVAPNIKNPAFTAKYFSATIADNG